MCVENNFGDFAPGNLTQCMCQEATGSLRQRLGRVNLYIMGAFGYEEHWWHPTSAKPGNYWTSLNDFPTASEQRHYLHAKNVLGNYVPTYSSSATYRYDPNDPAPMIGGDNLPHFGTMTTAASADQLPRETRSDVIVFDSEPLAGDLYVVGKIFATVFVSPTAKDTDFFITVSDLHPDKSKSMLVRYGIQRMRWRDSDAIQSPAMEANQVYSIKVDLGYIGYIFPKGHRIRVSVSSAAAPYFNPTSNTGENDMVSEVTPVVADNTVHFAAEYPSHITLPVVEAAAVPKNPNFTGKGPYTSQPLMI